MTLNPANYFSADDMSLAASLPQLRGSKELLSAIRQLRDEEDKKFRRKPKDSPEDWTQDWRYKLGMVDMAEKILSLPEAAGKLLSPKEDRDND